MASRCRLELYLHTSVCAAQCYSPEWQVIENQNSINGRRHSAARSVQECLDYCGGQRGCLAADVNLGERPPTCWVHFFAAYKTNAYSQPGTNQYRLTNRCAAGPITGYIRPINYHIDTRDQTHRLNCRTDLLPELSTVTVLCTRCPRNEHSWLVVLQFI